ncbi:MAG TPA: transglutaminase domain-containing protein, partial [candidate division Zixibacteria bacterium]|nr:transglutaminase domain-containing protein [candidate division Zixibacteria bacterium]
EFFRPIPTAVDQDIIKFKAWKLMPNTPDEEFDKGDLLYYSPGDEQAVYSEYGIAFIDFGRLTPGAIIAQEYEIVDSGLGLFSAEVVAQRQQPVGEIEIRVKAPDNWTAHFSALRGASLDYVRDGDWVIWRGEDLPYEPDEPLMPDWKYLEQRIAVSCSNPAISDSAGANSLASIGQFSDWSQVSRWVAVIYDSLAYTSPEIEELVDSLTQDAVSHADTVRRIADFVKREIRYVSVSLGNGRFVPRPAETTLKNRYGDCKDKTTLTRAMLAAAGIPSAATLASVQGFVNPYLPTPYQFDHCIVGAPLADSTALPEHVQVEGQGWSFIDPTDKITPTGELPAALRGGKILVAAPLDSALVDLPYTTADEWRSEFVSAVELQADGAISGVTRETLHGASVWYARDGLTRVPDSEVRELWQALLREGSPDARITDVSRYCDDDSCWTEVHYSVNRYALLVGAEWFLRPDPLLAGRRRLLQEPTRLHPIWFGAPSCERSTVNWTFPEGVTPLGTPAAEIELTPGSIKYSFAVTDENRSVYSREVRLNGEVIEPQDYPIAQRFDSALSAYSGQLINLRVNNEE